jgi:glycosyltransferase involved in cell wall biosynthesis
MNQPSNLFASSHATRPVILQLVPSLHSGGVERGTLEVARGLVEAGWGSVVASSGGPMVGDLEQHGTMHMTLPVDKKDIFSIYRNAKQLEKYIHEFGVDVVHARSRAPAWAGWLACKRTGTPFVTTFHGFYGLEGFKRYYNQVMTYGRPTIAVSDFIRQHILKHYNGVSEQEIEIVHSGVDTQHFSPRNVAPEAMRNLAKLWKVPNDKPVIFVPGRLTRWKGQHVLLQALASLKHRDFYCVLAGDQKRHPRYKHDLQKIIHKNGLKGHVYLATPTPYMVEAYALADLVISPSIDPEAFGRIPAEAQAMARPVIATGHGGAKETVKNGETGWLVPPRDAAEMAIAINKVLKLDDEQKKSMGLAGRKYMETTFDTTIVCQKTMTIYQQAMAAADAKAKVA